MAGNALPPLPLDLQHDYRGKCWWCGQPADSKEHRYKKTDVVKAFGAGPWVEKPLRFANGSGRGQEIQGPKSDRLKFAAVLCSPCNNARSQDFDHAYQTFSDFADAHAEAFAARAVVDFGKVYGSDRRHQQQLLTKYFVKHIGCRMAEDKIEVPQAVKDYLDGNRRHLPHLSIRLGANLDVYGIERHCEIVHSIPPGSLWSGEHMCTYSKSRRTLITAWSHIGYRWLWAEYTCDFRRAYGQTNFQRRRSRLATFHEPIFTEPMDAYCRECHPDRELQFGCA